MFLHLLIASASIAVGLLGAGGAHEDLGLCAGIDHDASRAHVQLDVDQAPDVAFVAAGDLQGTAILRLDSRGLLANEQLLCAWPDGRFEQTPEPNRVLRSTDGAACEQSPVKSGFGDNGTGTAVLCIEVVRYDDGLAEAEFRGGPIYFSLESLPAGKWGLEPASNGDGN